MRPCEATHSCKPRTTRTFIPGEVMPNGTGSFLALWAAVLQQPNTAPVTRVRGSNNGAAFTLQTDFLDRETVQWSPTSKRTMGKDSNSFETILGDDGSAFLRLNRHILQYDIKTGKVFWTWSDAHNWPNMQFENDENEVWVQSSGELFCIGYPREKDIPLDDAAMKARKFEATSDGRFEGKIEHYALDTWFVLKKSGMLGLAWH